jgi:hypothetical protein
MTWFYSILLILSIVIITIVVFTFLPRTAPLTSSQDITPYLLSSSPGVLGKNDVNSFLEDSSSAFQAFFYILPLQRTSTAAPCGTGDGLASCEDGRYDTCVCNDFNCANCAHAGYLPLFTINGACTVEVLPSPDASRQGKAMAQLVLKTEAPKDKDGKSLTDASGNSLDDTKGYYVETVALPQIPIQQWVMVTVSRTGRRFDVYYNNKLVSSTTALYTIAKRGNRESKIKLGNPGLSGYITYIAKYPSALTLFDVHSQYKLRVDTKGAPLLSQDLPQIEGNPSQSSSYTSLSSLPTNIVQSSPPSAGPLFEWETSYA